MQQYEATPCVNKALDVKYGKKTVAHDVYSQIFQRAYRFCFQTACWSADGVNRAVDVVSQITRQCQAEVKLFRSGGGEWVNCSEQCTQAVRAFDDDKCASHTLRHLPGSTEQKKFFWNVYAWAYDVCILKDSQAHFRAKVLDGSASSIRNFQIGTPALAPPPLAPPLAPSPLAPPPLPPLAPAVPPLAPMQAPGPAIAKNDAHLEVEFSCSSAKGKHQAEVVIEAVQLSCETEAAAFADEVSGTCRPPCQSALRRCAHHLTLT